MTFKVQRVLGWVFGLGGVGNLSARRRFEDSVHAIRQGGFGALAGESLYATIRSSMEMGRGHR
jgi:hypothetical protein